MYYSEKSRKAKVKELENDKKFMDYARKNYDERVMTWGADTFEEYLLKDVFMLYDNFTLIQFFETSDQKTIDKVMGAALKGLKI
jgi:hypothetical protein